MQHSGVVSLAWLAESASVGSQYITHRLKSFVCLELVLYSLVFSCFFSHCHYYRLVPNTSKKLLGRKQSTGFQTHLSCDPTVLLSSRGVGVPFCLEEGQIFHKYSVNILKENTTKTQKALRIIEAHINHFRRTILNLDENDLHISEQRSCKLPLCSEFLDFIKKDIQPSSFLIFLQNRDGSFFPLVSLKARHRHHYNRPVSSFRGILWPRLKPLCYRTVKSQQQFHLLWYLFPSTLLTVSSCAGMMPSVLHILTPR